MFEFESYPIYQKGLVLHQDIFSLIKSCPNIDIHFKDQIKRATTSIIANFAEGFGRFGEADKRRFYIISRGSAYEVVALLTLICRSHEIHDSQKNKLRTQLEEIVKMLTGLITSRLK